MFKQALKYASVSAASGTVVGSWFYTQSQEKQAQQNHQQKIQEITKLNATSENLNSYEHIKGIKKWDWNWDHREPTVTEKDETSDSDFVDVRAPGKNAYRHIYLIRHGQYDTEAKGDENRKLTTLGHEQARFTGDRLAHYFTLEKQRAEASWKKKNPEADASEFKYPTVKVFQSSMMRAQETSAEVQDMFKEAKLDFEFSGESDLLREGPPYPAEPPITKWCPEAAYWEESARIEAGFRKFIHRAEQEQDDLSHEVVVCHANVIRYFACRALQLPPEAWLRISLRHGSITHLVVSPKGSVSLRTLGDSGYMPVDKCSRR